MHRMLTSRLYKAHRSLCCFVGAKNVSTALGGGQRAVRDSSSWLLKNKKHQEELGHKSVTILQSFRT